MLRALFGSLAVVLAVAAEPAAELNDTTFAKWRDRIRPKSEEMCFATVNWLPELLQKKSINHHVALRVNNLYGIYRAVKSGIGIGALPEYFAQEGPGIVQVLKKYLPGAKNTIHTLILTHPDQDHYNMLADVLNETGASVTNVWFGGERDQYKNSYPAAQH